MDEYDALEDLFNALDGPSWNYYYYYYYDETPWNFKGNYSAPCDDHWAGVDCVCDLEFCFVSQLYLGGIDARGMLPSSIQYLSNLTKLELSGNYISSAIPSEIGLLTQLSELYLGSNYLTSIPQQIGQLKYLQVFQFDYNYITELSSGIGQLTSLTSLIGFSNPLYGTIPSEFGGLISLNYMNIGGGEFTGPFPSMLSTIHH